MQSFNLTHGTLYVWNDKSWTFVVDQTDAEVNGLNLGQVMTKTVKLTITDSGRGVAEKELTIRITGTNDAPTAVHSFAADSNGTNDSVTEAGHINAAMLSATSVVVAGDPNAAGSFSLDDADAENNTANLGVMIGQIAHRRRRHRRRRRQCADITTVVAHYARNVDDTDNAANQPDAGADVGGSEAGGATANIKGAYGTLTYVLTDHSWTYALGDNWDSVQQLDAGDRVADVFTFTFTDARGAQVTRDMAIRVIGTNDAPEIAAHGDTVGGATSAPSGDRDRGRRIQHRQWADFGDGC